MDKQAIISKMLEVIISLQKERKTDSKYSDKEYIEHEEKLRALITVLAFYRYNKTES